MSIPTICPRGRLLHSSDKSNLNLACHFNLIFLTEINAVKPVYKDHPRDQEKVVSIDRCFTVVELTLSVVQ